LGPRPISAQDGTLDAQNVGALPNSGRVSAIAVVDANTVYLGAASGGVWKTTNGGASWQSVTDGQVNLARSETANLAIGAIAIDPSDANTVYVGLGEQNNATDSYQGNGILKSTDAGSSWTLLTGNPPVFAGQHIGRVAVDP